MLHKVFTPIKSVHEHIVVGVGAVTGIEVLNDIDLQSMGNVGEIIKLSLQAIVAVAAVIKYFKKPKIDKNEQQ